LSRYLDQETAKDHFSDRVKLPPRASVENFSGGESQRKKRPKNSIIYKPPSTLSVSCMKIQRDHGPPLPPRCLRPWLPPVTTSVTTQR